jgi:hypothetical protein
MIETPIQEQVLALWFGTLLHRSRRPRNVRDATKAVACSEIISLALRTSVCCGPVEMVGLRQWMIGG